MYASTPVRTTSAYRRNERQVMSFGRERDSGMRRGTTRCVMRHDDSWDKRLDGVDAAAKEREGLLASHAPQFVQPRDKKFVRAC